MTFSTRRAFGNARALAVAALATLVAAGAAAGQAPATVPAPGPVTAYEKIPFTDPDVQAAVKVAVARQQQKNSSQMMLLSIVSAERQAVSGRNMRLCLSMDRSGNTEMARVVLSRNTRKQWSVTIWSWGSCGR